MKLIEVAVPVDAMNRAGQAEKAVPKKGLPATMHLWWSRKPTGLARAVLFASIVDDPTSRPDLFATENEQVAERGRLWELTAELARWDCPRGRIDEARRLIVERSDGASLPTVIDPFCGGGSIPLEASRLGLTNVGIDLNPVAAIISKGLVEIPAVIHGLGPVHPQATARLHGDPGMRGVGEDVERYGEELIERVRVSLASSYPPVRDARGRQTQAVSYLWARTATCRNPRCRAELPMLSTWWLSKRAKNFWHVRPRIVDGRVEFEVHEGAPPAGLEDLKAGRGANFRCAQCGEVTEADEIRAQGQSGGLGLRLVAIQTFRDPTKPRGGRAYIAPDRDVERAALAAWPAEKEFPFDHVELPSVAGNIHSFGVRTLGQLLTPRQKALMVALCEQLQTLRDEIKGDALARGVSDDPTPLRSGGRGATAYAETVTTYLAITISRMANRVSTMTIHNRANGSVEQSFVQPAYAFYGDFPEADPFSGSTGSWDNSLEHVARAVEELPVGARSRIECASALTALVGRSGVVSTDPPYYDMFDYAALSDLFYPWLRLSLSEIWPDETSSLLAPEADQVVSNPSRHDGDKAAAHAHFEQRLLEAFKILRSVQDPAYPMTLYYGYQQTEQRREGRSSTAWEALLEALVASGFCIVRTWPLRTERPEGVKTGTNALASSILLVCRDRADDASVVTRQEFVRSLKDELPSAVRLLQASNIAPVDLAQAAIGPGMAVFTRHARVVEADGAPMRVRTALELINQVFDETLAGTDSDLDSDTRWAVTWFEDRGMNEGDYGRAEQLSKSRNTSVPGLTTAGIVVARAGKVRLVGLDELSDSWSPASDGRLTVWELTHHLVKRLTEDGEAAAAALLSDAGPTADAAKELAYRLYQICDRKSWAKDAGLYNALVTAWPELERLAADGGPIDDGQGRLL